MKILVYDRLGDCLGEIKTPDVPDKGEKVRFFGYSGELVEGYVDLVTRDYRKPKLRVKISLTHILYGT